MTRSGTIRATRGFALAGLIALVAASCNSAPKPNGVSCDSNDQCVSGYCSCVSACRSGCCRPQPTEAVQCSADCADLQCPGEQDPAILLLDWDIEQTSYSGDLIASDSAGNTQELDFAGAEVSARRFADGPTLTGFTMMLATEGSVAAIFDRAPGSLGVELHFDQPTGVFPISGPYGSFEALPEETVQAAYWREQDAQSELTGSIDVESFQIEVGRRDSAVFDISLGMDGATIEFADGSSWRLSGSIVLSGTPSNGPL